MKKPLLVIMAAGMGSRYGGLKQIDPIDEEGHIIIDFSIYDAKRAGFDDIIFIIKKEDEEDFKDAVGNRMERIMNVSYAYQDLNHLPEGFSTPAGRTKPWGTAHAVLSAAGQIDRPFAVINADDYYGTHAFGQIFDYLSTHEDDEKMRYTMVGYQLQNTVTDNGHVARGVCSLDSEGQLISVTERTRIEKHSDGIAYTEDDGNTWTSLPDDTIVSMNMWGFTKSILPEIQNGFSDFLTIGLKENPLKCEYFLPTVVSKLLDEEKASVEVLATKDKWFGVTYRKDKPIIEEAIKEMKQNGIYPEKLWEEK